YHYFLDKSEWDGSLQLVEWFRLHFHHLRKNPHLPPEHHGRAEVLEYFHSIGMNSCRLPGPENTHGTPPDCRRRQREVPQYRCSRSRQAPADRHSGSRDSHFGTNPHVTPGLIDFRP